MADALRRVEGAFSLVMMSNDRIFAARDPRGFRPLAMGKISAVDGHKHDTFVFASETCAFDLIGAEYIRDVKPGELIIVGPGRREFAVLFDRGAAVQLHFRTRLFFAAGQPGVRAIGSDQPRGTGPPVSSGSGCGRRPGSPGA